MRRGNLRSGIPAELSQELCTPLTLAPGVRIERIVSRGHVTAADDWYDQDQHEFVLVVDGAARLELAELGVIAMGPGDWLVIPARQRHRVVWTDGERDTVWLTVFYDAETT